VEVDQGGQRNGQSEPTTQRQCEREAECSRHGEADEGEAKVAWRARRADYRWCADERQQAGA